MEDKAMMQGMSQNVHGMMGCDGGGWFMMGTHVIVLVVLVLAAAARRRLRMMHSRAEPAAVVD